MISPVVLNPDGTLRTVPLIDVLRRLTEPGRPRAASRPRAPRARPVVVPKAPRYPPITPEVEAAIVRARLGGGLVADLAPEFGIGEARVSAILHAHGLGGDLRRARALRHADEIRARLTGGELARTIALDLGISEWSVHRVREAAGLVIRRQWTDEEIATFVGASSRRDAVRRYREAFPASTRSDETVIKQIAKRFPGLSSGRPTLSPGERRERERRRTQAWRAANPERVRESNRRGCQKNREARLAYNKAWRAANPERVRETQRQYRERTHDAQIARQKAYREAHRDEIRERNRERNREYRARKTAETREAAS